MKVARSLDTDFCFNALHRFHCKRFSDICTDHGTNFVGTQRELREALKEMDHHNIELKGIKVRGCTV